MNFKNRLWIMIASLLFSNLMLAQSSNIFINEFLASNVSAIKSPAYNEYADWIEIYNKNNSNIDLSGYYLTDDLKDPVKWKIPTNTVIPSNGYLIFWADGRNVDLHTNFKLSKDGESIGIYSPSGTVIDTISFYAQYDDISYGRFADDITKWSYFKPSTPQSKNISSNEIAIAQTPKFSILGGLYKSSQLLTISTAGTSSEIRYTTDGMFPVKSSKLYSEPIKIDSTVSIRACAFEVGKSQSQTVTQTYFINEEIHLPVISLVTDPKNLFDDKIGIYITGTNGIRGACDPTIRNLNQDWERPVNIEYYDINGKMGFNQGAGIKIFGGCSRTRYPQKSFALYARNEYGKGSFDYKLFSAKPIKTFESFVLRSSADDQVFTFLRDALAHSVMAKPMDADIQAYEPAVVFINGKYWGIHDIREKINENYFAENFGIDPADLNILEANGGIVYGTNAGYTNMVNYANNNNLSIQSNYEYIKTLMDVDQFIDYQIGHIFLAERDWPGNNIKYWRANSGEFNKWRWINYDLDQTFTMLWLKENMINKATVTNGPSWPNPDWSTKLLRNLLKNVEFKNEFIQRYAWHSNTTFKPERLIHFIDSLAAKIAPEIPRHIKRWGGKKDPDFHESWTPKATFNSIQEWNTNVDTLRLFSLRRPEYSTAHMIQKFGLSGISNLNIKSNNSGSGVLKIIDRRIPDDFFGKFYNDIPLKISAVPMQGKKFSHWEVEGSSSQTVPIINAGAVWKYNDSGVDLKNLWSLFSYDDSKWNTGAAQLGYGDGDEVTVIKYGPSTSSRYITTYFRKSFSISDRSVLQSLVLEVLADDGAVVYLNGNEVQRVNMPAGTIQFSTLASGAVADENAFAKFTIPSSVLVNGENVISVEVHQSAASSSDLSFDLKLSGISPVRGGITKYSTPDINILLSGDTKATAFFETDSQNQSVPVVINEINYKSASDFDSDDWIEIYNYGNVFLDLSGWQLKDSGVNSSFIIPANITLDAKEYLVLCKDSSKFLSKYPAVKKLAGNLTFGLSSDGEKIILSDSNGKFIDEVTYAIQSPWPVNTNGSGRTIELKNYNLDNNQGSAWADSKNLHGSPGIMNSAFIEVAVLNEKLPTEYSLSQNYPNPFNPITTISFRIQETGYVTLKVHDILGREVATLVNEIKSPGNYYSQFPSSRAGSILNSQFPSGVYFYTLKAGNFVCTKKMMLIK